MTVVPAYTELLELAWVTPLAVLAVCSSYSLFLLGVTRSSERRKDGHAGAATAFLGLAAVSGVVFAALVVAGIWVIVAG
jgi:hypothetical protein